MKMESTRKEEIIQLDVEIIERFENEEQLAVIVGGKKRYSGN